MGCTSSWWRRLLAVSLALLLAFAATRLAVAQGQDVAWVLVKLPPGAEKATISFGSYVTKTTGRLERWFVSPPLEPGKTYSYEVTAIWTMDGKEHKYTEKASVAAAKETTVDFTKAMKDVKKDDGKKDDTKKDDTSSIPTAPVAGKVTLDGKPLARCRVTFWPENKGKLAQEVGGLTDEDGTYQLFTKGKPGVPPGRYRVTITATAPTDPKDPAKLKVLVPEKYAKLETTPLLVEVTEKAPPGAYDIRIGEEPKKDDNKKDNGKSTSVPSRTFHFTYATTITGLAPGKEAKIWVPLPQSTPEQDVTVVKESVPGTPSVGTDAQYGNKMLFVEANADKDGNIPVSLTFKVTRKAVQSVAGFRSPGAGEKIARFLQPDKLVPIDGKPLELVKDKQLGKTQFDTTKVLYDIVNSHMKYSKKGTGWGNGDAVWACDSKFGNCSDFHSLFISLARSQKIPAKFEMGFGLPAQHGSGTVGGYHCWAWVLPDGKGWVPVDISEANQHPEKTGFFFGNLDPNRVQFTTGRDIDLIPRQAGPALNFFIYPHVEVEGKALPREQIKNSFSYSDVNP
jgi:uncharacterized protein (TIGR03000 family)